MTTPFVLSDDPSTFRDAAALIVRIPHGIRSKEKLFGIYADSLRLPKYFGRNWDALEECLRDLSWLPANQAVAIIHEDLPFGPGGEYRAIYVDLLREFLNHWSAANSRHVQVIFPSRAESDLTPAASEPR